MHNRRKGSRGGASAKGLRGRPFLRSHERKIPYIVQRLIPIVAAKHEHSITHRIVDGRVPPPGASGVVFQGVVKQLGIAQALETKIKPGASADEVLANITGGAAEIAVLPVSEILPVKGAALGGVFPADVQTYIVMAGATANAASQAARDCLARLTSPASDAVITAKGMERGRP